jgi:hypothetical protein
VWSIFPEHGPSSYTAAECPHIRAQPAIKVAKIRVDGGGIETNSSSGISLCKWQKA